MPRKVAVALDSDTCSVEALEWLLKAFLTPKDEVSFVHVMDQRPIELPESEQCKKLRGYGYANLTELNNCVEKLHEAKAVEMMKEFAKQSLKRGIDAETVLLKGNVKYKLCEFAEKESINVFAVGSRGLGVASRMMLGSVSDYCVHNMKCPVIVVKCTGLCEKR
mmetsp:Transcript_25050/g.48930  ORF Transcript_25050/g.48930 Transcript_25050/m.48930 type:complete len:164 (-) Transcript_25050:177-668(-)